MRSEQEEALRQAAIRKYNHRTVRDRYDADLLMAGFEDGAAWVLDQLRDVIANHPQPECDKYIDEDPIKCGWKSAYVDVVQLWDEATK